MGKYIKNTCISKNEFQNLYIWEGGVQISEQQTENSTWMEQECQWNLKKQNEDKTW